MYKYAHIFNIQKKRDIINKSFLSIIKREGGGGKFIIGTSYVLHVRCTRRI